jgi:hypothetical protein
MPKYKTTWLDGKLPSGQLFAVAVCGYSGKIRHMTIGDDPTRRILMRFETVDGNQCQVSNHCLATDCPLNKTENKHMMHMLDMYYEEKLDPESSNTWETDSVLEGLLKFATKMNESVPAELRRGMILADPDDSDPSQNEAR